jgi:Putative peptidoglycan binding domain
VVAPSRGVYLRNQRVFHKPLAWFSIAILGAGLAGATTRPSSHHRHSSKRNSSAPSRKSGARLSRVSAKTRLKTKNRKARGQQTIQGDRAREIQNALIREGYLSGEPSGVWDQQTKDAMTRYQADHGWQTKTLPDSRALIQLGLGPNHETAVNAQAVPANLPSQPAKNSAVPENRQ